MTSSGEVMGKDLSGLLEKFFSAVLSLLQIACLW